MQDTEAPRSHGARLSFAAAAILDAFKAKRTAGNDALVLMDEMPCPNCGRRLYWTATGKVTSEAKISATCETRECLA